MSKLNELIEEIRKDITITNSKGKEVFRKAASMKDEERVMREMLNDKEYKVDIYDRTGKTGEYCPAEDARDMISNVISGSTKVSLDEAKVLADNYEFKKSDSESMINLSKEYVNTYVQTGRKLPLGGRETFSADLHMRHEESRQRMRNQKVGEDAKGEPMYDNVEVTTKDHDSIKCKSSAPKWVK